MGVHPTHGLYQFVTVVDNRYTQLKFSEGGKGCFVYIPGDYFVRVGGSWRLEQNWSKFECQLAGEVAQPKVDRWFADKHGWGERSGRDERAAAFDTLAKTLLAEGAPTGVVDDAHESAESESSDVEPAVRNPAETAPPPPPETYPLPKLIIAEPA